MASSGFRVTLDGPVPTSPRKSAKEALPGEYLPAGQHKGKTWYEQRGGGAKLHYAPGRHPISGRIFHWCFGPADEPPGGGNVLAGAAETPGGGVPQAGWRECSWPSLPIPLRVTPIASAACDPAPPPAAQAAATAPTPPAAQAPAAAPQPPPAAPEAAADPTPPAAQAPAAAPQPPPAAKEAAADPTPPAAQAPAAAPQPPPAAPDAAAAKQRDLSGNDDARDVTFKPLVKFVSDFKPSKGADAYLKEDTLQVESISTTTGPFMDDIVQAARQITDDRVRNTSVLRQHEGLTEDHVFAIVAFTLEVQSFCLAATEDAEFYRQYNIALRKRAPKVMRSLAGYSHFLLGGLSRMPGFQGTLWRGIRDEEAVKLALDNYQPLAREIFWSAFSSASPDRSVARNFATSKGLIFCLTVQDCARDIKAVSAIPNEEERLILPNTKLIVIKTAFKASDGVWEIHLAESPGSSFVF